MAGAAAAKSGTEYEVQPSDTLRDWQALWRSLEGDLRSQPRPDQGPGYDPCGLEVKNTGKVSALKKYPEGDFLFDKVVASTGKQHNLFSYPLSI
jgi:hypothetical protein